MSSPGSAEINVRWVGKRNGHLTASCNRNIPTKNYQNLIIGFQVKIKNVGDVFLRHSVHLITLSPNYDFLIKNSLSKKKKLCFCAWLKFIRGTTAQRSRARMSLLSVHWIKCKETPLTIVDWHINLMLGRWDTLADWWLTHKLRWVMCKLGQVRSLQV